MNGSTEMIWKRFVTSALICTLFACGNVRGGTGTLGTKLDDSLRSMRLGATSRADSAVLLSVAIDTREVITVLNSSAEANAINQILYRTSEGDTVSIAVGSDGIPISAETASTILTFSRATTTGNDILVDAEVSGERYPTVSAPIPEHIEGLLSSKKSLSSNTSKKDATTNLQELLARAIIGVRVFGCSSENALAQLGVSSRPAEIAAKSCQSVLVDTAQRSIEQNTLDQVETDTIAESSACDAATSGSVDTAELCLDSTGSDLIENVLQNTPDLDSAVTGLTDPNVEIPTSGNPVPPDRGQGTNGNTTTTTLPRTTTTTLPRPPTSPTTTTSTTTSTTTTTITTTTTTTTTSTTITLPQPPGGPVPVDPGDPTNKPPVTPPTPPV